MSQDGTGENRERRDFFISYTGSDRQWAEWIAWQLEEAGYTLFVQAWDFRPGSNFVAEMDRAAKCAERTLLVLSSAYLDSDYAFAEWAAAFRQDPRGTRRQLLPVRIEPCRVDGLLGPVVYIDLVSLDEAQARERLLAGVQEGRAKPAMVAFPGQNTPQELHAHAAFPGSLPIIWNIPYLRNPVFTGREQLLTQLADALKSGEAVALAQPQAISGLGGVGKTQIVVEYAYRHRQDYQAVLWTLADTRESLISGYVEIARLLNLREKGEQDQQLVVKAVQEWLRTQNECLLILDNADDLTLAREFLPPIYSGHILLTTRAQTTGTLARRLEIETMDTEAGALLLLRRAGMVAPDASLETASSADRTVACQINEELGGLPLALDQAGAYIEETACNLADYQHLYQTRRADLLRTRGTLGDDHPQPVATTWSLSFDQVEQRNPAAADLLRLCAFLAPDAILEAILIAGAAELGPTLAPIATDTFYLNKAIAALRAYSLITRDPQSRTLTVHRLVQAVLRDSMPAETQQQWMQRAVLAVAAACPSADFANWPTIERLLPHALTCASLLESQAALSPEEVELLNKTALYLLDRARHKEANRSSSALWQPCGSPYRIIPIQPQPYITLPGRTTGRGDTQKQNRSSCRHEPLMKRHLGEDTLTWRYMIMVWLNSIRRKAGIERQNICTDRRLPYESTT